MLTIRTVLYPTDFSDCSEVAFRLACGLAWDYGARLVILHVTPSPVDGYGEGILPPQPADYLGPWREKLQQMQASNPEIAVEYRLVEGDAVAEILRAAQETNSDLIVLGTHGRTGLARLLVGSTAELVVRRAPCPVVTVTPACRELALSARAERERTAIRLPPQRANPGLESARKGVQP
jgi:nucleotide-binding universal stress UspA family protein